jgi:hypothetical protein
MTNFTWSYSSLKEYLNCPKQYQEIRVLKRATKSDTSQTIYGKEVHLALEEYVRDGKPLAKNYQMFKEIVDSLIAIKGEKLCEYEMAVNRDRQPCEFEDENRWVRGIADLVIIDDDTAYVIDYKTGSDKYADPKQLRLMSLMIFAHFPDVQKVKGGLLFVLKNSFVQEEYLREDIDKSWMHFTPSLERLKNSYDMDTWVANPTPLCRYCPVSECDFHRG